MKPIVIALLLICLVRYPFHQKKEEGRSWREHIKYPRRFVSCAAFVQSFMENQGDIERKTKDGKIIKQARR